jgi:hypothetical protein
MLFAPIMEIMMHITSANKYILFSAQFTSCTIITDAFYFRILFSCGIPLLSHAAQYCDA